MVGKSGFWACVLDFLAVFPTRYAEPAGIILKLRWKFCVMGLELYRSSSRTVPKRAEMPFTKLNGKSENIQKIAPSILLFGLKTAILKAKSRNCVT